VLSAPHDGAEAEEGNGRLEGTAQAGKPRKGRRAGFEIGLLNRSVRTATVTADAPGRLLEMDGDDFLQLVGAGGDLRGRLLGLYGVQGGSRTA